MRHNRNKDRRKRKHHRQNNYIVSLKDSQLVTNSCPRQKNKKSKSGRENDRCYREHNNKNAGILKKNRLSPDRCYRNSRGKKPPIGKKQEHSDRCFRDVKKKKTQALRVQGFHSKSMMTALRTMKIRILPALQDNYMYLLIDTSTNSAAIVDPVEPETVLEAVKEEGVSLTTVLTTHHHWDHSGGNVDLVKKMPTVKVYGGDDRIGALTNQIAHDSTFKVGNLEVHCLATPCHTTGHICFYVTSQDEGDSGVVFTGDTLFLGGCGRFFEGTAEQMYSALIEKLGNLPDDTLVYCGHEYSLQNLKFGNHVEPDNQDILDKIQWASEKRKDKLPTVPSTIGEEKKINPFMRVMQPSVQKYSGCEEPISTMAFIRSKKDNFK